ncbi:MAG: hypothetical protein FJY85_12140 [Deltaproteobacteria bacterium]|nr:hypothetical protein [Deltaproteobacteria bacterium]
MVKRDLSDDQIKADVLNRLVNAGAFGSHHIPVDQMRNWIQNKIKRNGKTVTKCIEELARSGLLVKTARNTIYLDHNRLEEAFQYIDKHLR